MQRLSIPVKTNYLSLKVWVFADFSCPRKNPNIWMFEAWIIKIAPLVANEKPQNMWERDNSVLSSDLCNYIPAVPSWWEICRFWSCLESSSEICWRVEDYLLVNTFSLFDLTTPPLRQWNEWQFEVIELYRMAWFEVTLQSQCLKITKIFLFLAWKLK